jgi:hypothetical protein
MFNALSVAFRRRPHRRMNMQSNQLQQRIQQVEQSADQAKQAVQQGQSPSELRECVESVHQQLSQAKKQPQMGEESLRGVILQAEQGADRALQACRNGGPGVDQQTQQAVKRLHDELSGLKREMQMQ